ncbi:hypothetical protein BS47DRAFT_1258319, partial [Hydnum rufescens UP504]
LVGSHPQSSTHHLRIRDGENHLIPVPIGPGIPHRDVAKEEQYSCLMLILFKPWRTPHDLCRHDETWKQAFEQFKPELSLYHRAVIDNMQKLHECKDSHD